MGDVNYEIGGRGYLSPGVVRMKIWQNIQDERSKTDIFISELSIPFAILRVGIIDFIFVKMA